MTASARWRVWIDRPVPPGLVVPDDVELCDSVDSADAAIIGSDEQWDAEACAGLPRLKVLARSGIGFDNVDVAGCASVGVAACNTPDAPTVSTAEHTLALLMATAKKVKLSELRLRTGLGEYRSGHNALELHGRTLGLVGCGRIGRLVAHYGAALGMNVLVHDPYLAAAAAADLPGGAVLVDLDELWHRSDVISLHAPATESTRRMINADSIAAMRAGVIIINCARGALIDQDALLAGLESGHVGAAGLDVTEPEPLPADHPLLGRDDVIVTPHVASATVVGLLRLVDDALGQAMQWLRGATPEHLLGPQAADPAVDRRLERPSALGTDC